VELEQVRGALHDAALVDELLGIGNETAMRFALERAHAAALRYRRPYAVALVDVDRFHLYNERHGAGRADTTLRRVARQLCGAIRRADSLYRRHGDRMLALMPETHAEGAAGLTERMRSEVEALAIPLDGPDDPLTVSVGWAAWNPGRPQESADALVERAGRALVRAKEDGRNRVAAAPED
jgi:diguanylate cyclase (GGDEF)-like protein